MYCYLYLDIKCNFIVRKVQRTILGKGFLASLRCSPFPYNMRPINMSTRFIFYFFMRAQQPKYMYGQRL